MQNVAQTAVRVRTDKRYGAFAIQTHNKRTLDRYLEISDLDAFVTWEPHGVMFKGAHWAWPAWVLWVREGQAEELSAFIDRTRTDRPKLVATAPAWARAVPPAPTMNNDDIDYAIPGLEPETATATLIRAATDAERVLTFLLRSNATTGGQIVLDDLRRALCQVQLEKE